MPRRSQSRLACPKRLRLLSVASVWLVCGGTAAAQTTRVTPTLSISETLLDNYRGSAAADGRSESITAITPGLRLSSRRGRVQGSVDYGLTGVYHARDTNANSFQNALSASIRAEAVPNHLDINATGSISRQAVSAFGRQSFDGTLTDTNQTELRTFSVSPVLRGEIPGVMGLQASVTASRTSGSEQVSSNSRDANLTLSSVRPGRLGWSLNGSRQVSDYDGGRKTTNDRLTASIIITPVSDWRFTLRGGQERTDIASVQRQSYDNWGAGVNWTPGPRTTVSMDADRRYFGNSYNVSFQHRQRRAVWRYTASHSATDSAGSTGAAGVRAYDLFFQLFASQEPDPALRDLLVRSFLDNNGIPAGTLIGGGFINSATAVQRRQELSVALNGRRSSGVLSAFASNSSRADAVANPADDLAGGPVRQRGLTVALSHQLTPRDGLSLTASVLRTSSNAINVGNSLKTLAGSWSKALSQRANFSLGVRHSEYDSTDPYTENAITAAFATSF